MGNREDLLSGALQCLMDKGYARTTARDVASQAGTSLAAIGYHFGSTERLLQEAIATGFQRWRARFGSILLESAGRSPKEKLAGIGSELDRLFAEEHELTCVFLEALGVADRAEDIRMLAASSYQEDRLGVTALLRELRGWADESDPMIASILLAVVDGLIIQHAILGSEAPSPGQALSLLAPLILGPAAMAEGGHGE